MRGADSMAPANPFTEASSLSTRPRHHLRLQERARPLHHGHRDRLVAPAEDGVEHAPVLERGHIAHLLQFEALRVDAAGDVDRQHELQVDGGLGAARRRARQRPAAAPRQSRAARRIEVDRGRREVTRIGMPSVASRLGSIAAIAATRTGGSEGLHWGSRHAMTPIRRPADLARSTARRLAERKTTRDAFRRDTFALPRAQAREKAQGAVPALSQGRLSDRDRELARAPRRPHRIHHAAPAQRGLTLSTIPRNLRSTSERTIRERTGMRPSLPSGA